MGYFTERLGHNTVQNANSLLLGTDIQTNTARRPLCKFHGLGLWTRPAGVTWACPYPKQWCIVCPSWKKATNKQTNKQEPKSNRRKKKIFRSPTQSVGHRTVCFLLPLGGKRQMIYINYGSPLCSILLSTKNMATNQARQFGDDIQR